MTSSDDIHLLIDFVNQEFYADFIDNDFLRVIQKIAHSL